MRHGNISDAIVGNREARRISYDWIMNYIRTGSENTGTRIDQRGVHDLT
jgi:hypothetical protein